MEEIHRTLYARYQRYTMSPRPTYIANLCLAAHAAAVPGAIVECGTWRGGLIAGVAQLLGDDREYWLFDSFEGLPPLGENDGQDAMDWQAQGDNSCTAPEVDAQVAMRLSQVSRYHIVKGWFYDTLPLARFPEGIAYLRADGDLYDSIYETLDCLFPLVNQGGIISIDDYYAFEGCGRAVHDYLSDNKRPERIESMQAAGRWEVPPGPGTPDHQWGACFLRKL
jgi:O-methyltransferase